MQGLLSAKLSQRIVKHMREELFDKLMDLPIRYLDTHSHGDVMSRMTNDIENISMTISQSLPSLFSGVLTMIGTVSIMLWYCWQLALLSFATVILTVFATKFLSKRVHKFSLRRQILLGQLNGTVEEMVSGYHTVVAYNHQDITIEEFCKSGYSDRYFQRCHGTGYELYRKYWFCHYCCFWRLFFGKWNDFSRRYIRIYCLCEAV